MDQSELLQAILQNVLSTDDPAELAHYAEVLADPEKLAELADALDLEADDDSGEAA